MSEENGLFHLPPETIQTRWASAENPDALPGAGGITDKGRKGAPCRRNLEPGETFIMAHAAGAGIVHRFWITINDRSPQMLRGLVLRLWWDGEGKPAVEVPLGDFFCLPLGRMIAFENAWFDTGEGRSFTCRVPMPFRSSFLMTVTNESPANLAMFFYDVNFTIGDQHGPDVGYFHAHWRRENPTTIGQDFEILPRVQGRGRFLGCNMGVVANQALYDTLWWGEGEVKIYLDGDTDFPTLCGTGTEDYIGTGWGQGPYSRLWHGSPLADREQMCYGFYRLHGPDPVFFHRDIRVTIQQIGHGTTEKIAAMMERADLQELPVTIEGGRLMALDEIKSCEGGLLFERQDDWCSTAYFYLDRPCCELPPIAPFEERVTGLEDEAAPAARLDQ